MNINPTTIPTRRQILQGLTSGFGFLAFSGLSTLAAANEKKSTNPLAPKEPHFTPRAKRVIFLCMRGGPSHVDTFDYKPELQKSDGKDGKYRGKLVKSQWDFQQRGESGLWISDLFPNISKQADELCLVRSMHTDQPIHPRAMTQLHTGNAAFIRPSLGAWALYGLGTENDSMPGFVSMNPAPGSAQNYGSAFLPAIYQGTKLGGNRRGGGGPQGGRGRDAGSQVPDIKNRRFTDKAQRAQLDFIQALNQEKLRQEKEHPGVEGVIESYELAFRMQTAMPEVMDMSEESAETLSLYGIGGGATDNFGRQCLMARRFAEAGVRFIEVAHSNWDHHANLSNALPTAAEQIDKPVAGLLADLKRRDMLKDTLVLWSGEFGRTPDSPSGDGRDHNNKGFTSWMAGGGVKGGFSYGSTDEFGYEAVENKCHIHDWHATILHLLGLNHEQLTYRYAGRDFRLTDVHGNVMKDILG